MNEPGRAYITNEAGASYTVPYKASSTTKLERDLGTVEERLRHVIRDQQILEAQVNRLRWMCFLCGAAIVFLAWAALT